MVQKEKESNPEMAEFTFSKGHNTAIINREKGNSVLVHADQIRPQGENMKSKMKKKSLRFLPLMICKNNLYRMKTK